MIQIDGIKRQVYIKMVVSVSVLAIRRDTGRQAEYKYPTGELLVASLAVAAMGTKRIRVANLPPEEPKETLRAALAPFGKIRDIYIFRGERYSAGDGNADPTLIVPFNRRRGQSLTVLWGAACHLLRL